MRKRVPAVVQVAWVNIINCFMLTKGDNNTRKFLQLAGSSNKQDLIT